MKLFLKQYYYKKNIRSFFWESMLVLIFLGTCSSSFAQDTNIPYNHAHRPPVATELMEWHEVLTYEVRYSFFKLGEVKVEIISDTLYNGQKSWHLRSVITSNSGIPFVGKEENHYNSIFRVVENTFQVQEFWTDNVDEGEYRDSEYIFDREKGKVFGYESEKDQPRDTLAMEEPASSGHSLLYRSRLTAGTGKRVKFPVYINLEKKYITLSHTTETDTREYDAFPDEVKTFYTKGVAEIDGPFGFSGEFEAWYLADDLRVPVEARVKVWLGKVKVKLINYKKERRDD